MKLFARFGWLVSLALVTGCSSTVCDDALDKAHECGLTDLELNDAGEECADYSACTAECILDAGCNDIQGAVNFEENDLTECITVCGE